MIRTVTITRLRPLARLLPSDIYFWCKAFLLALVAIQLAKLFWIAVTPVGPFGDWRPAPARVLSAEAQSALFASVDPFFRPGAMAGLQAQAAPALNLQLFGVRASQGALPGSAIIGPADGEQTNYLVGEEVAPGVKLAGVHFDHVILARGGAEQKLFMPGAEEGATQAGNAQSPAIAGAAARITNAFQMRPRRQGTAVTGVLVTPGGDPALFQAAGFRAGDVIVAVNGAKITSMIDVEQFQSSIAPGARLMLSVERGASVVPIALNLPGNP